MALTFFQPTHPAPPKPPKPDFSALLAQFLPGVLNPQGDFGPPIAPSPLPAGGFLPGMLPVSTPEAAQAAPMAAPGAAPVPGVPPVTPPGAQPFSPEAFDAAWYARNPMPQMTPIEAPQTTDYGPQIQALIAQLRGAYEPTPPKLGLGDLFMALAGLKYGLPGVASVAGGIEEARQGRDIRQQRLAQQTIVPQLQETLREKQTQEGRMDQYQQAKGLQRERLDAQALEDYRRRHDKDFLAAQTAAKKDEAVSEAALNRALEDASQLKSQYVDKNTIRRMKTRITGLVNQLRQQGNPYAQVADGTLKELDAQEQRAPEESPVVVNIESGMAHRMTSEQLAKERQNWARLKFPEVMKQIQTGNQINQFILSHLPQKEERANQMVQLAFDRLAQSERSLQLDEMYTPLRVAIAQGHLDLGEKQYALSGQRFDFAQRQAYQGLLGKLEGAVASYDRAISAAKAGLARAVDAGSLNLKPLKENINQLTTARNAKVDEYNRLKNMLELDQPDKEYFDSFSMTEKGLPLNVPGTPSYQKKAKGVPEGQLTPLPVLGPIVPGANPLPYPKGTPLPNSRAGLNRPNKAAPVKTKPKPAPAKPAPAPAKKKKPMTLSERLHAD